MTCVVAVVFALYRQSLPYHLIYQIVDSFGGVCIEWDVEKYGSNPLLKATFKDHPIREGYFNIEACAEKYENLVGGQDRVYTTAASKNKQGIQKSSGDTCYSVENNPLRTLTSLDSSLPPDPLHLFEGFVNHLNKETLVLMKKEVAGGGWINKVFNVKEIVKEATKMKTDIENTKDYLSAKYKLQKTRKGLEAVYGKINEQVENNTYEITDDLIREKDRLIEIIQMN